MSSSSPPCDLPLIERLDAAVRLGEVRAVTSRIKDELEAASRDESLRLAGHFYQPCPDRYARRLLHRNEELGYTAVVMTWGPGQGTPVHDHCGMWCVECVVAGEMEVVQFELEERLGERYRFSSARARRAAVGAAGALIPPSEYHILRNRRMDATSVTLHVYGGEMDRCSIFLPDGEGLYRREPCPLTYND